MKYVKPMIVMNEDLSEGVFAGSGDCWTVRVYPDQNDAGGYKTFRVQANHSKDLEHLSKATTICVTFDRPIISAEYEGFSVKTSGTMVIGERESLGDSYLSGDNFNSLLKVWATDYQTLSVVSATISCTKEVNVQGKGGSEL